MKVVPISEHHPYYCSDEIEVWEVTLRNDSDAERGAGDYGEVDFEMRSWGNRSVVEGDYGETRLCIEQNLLGGALGCVLWPSSVVMTR